MSLIFSFNATAYSFEDPLDVMITIGWEYILGTGNHYFMNIEISSRNIFHQNIKNENDEGENYLYSNLSDDNVPVPGDRNHLYFLNILKQFQIYIPFEIYQKFTNPEICSEDGICRWKTHREGISDISSHAVLRYPGENGINGYYKYFEDLIEGRSKQSPPLETYSVDDTSYTSDEETFSEEEKSSSSDSNSNIKKNNIIPHRKKSISTSSTSNTCYLESMTVTASRNSTYILNINTNQLELKYYDKKDNLPKIIPISNVPNLEKELKKILSNSKLNKRVFQSIQNNSLKKIITLSESLKIGSAINEDNGYFDSLRQILNARSHSSNYTQESLCNACKPNNDLKEDSKSAFDDYNKKSVALCQNLKLTCIYIIKIVIEDKKPKIVTCKITSNNYVVIDEIKSLEEIKDQPCLIFSEKDAQFAPILPENWKPSDEEILANLSTSDKNSIEKIISLYHSKNLVDIEFNEWGQIFAQLTDIIDSSYLDNLKMQEAAFIYQAHLFLNNANFTADEKRSFNYASSPLQNQPIHSYLRTDKNLPIFTKSKKILGVPQESIFINVDYSYLQNTLKHYFKTIATSNFDDEIENIISNTSEEELTCILLSNSDEIQQNDINKLYEKISIITKIPIDEIKEKYIICYIKRIEKTYALCYPDSIKALQERLNILTSLGHVVDVVTFYKSIFNFYCQEGKSNKRNIFHELFIALEPKLKSINSATFKADLNISDMQLFVSQSSAESTDYHNFMKNIIVNLDIVNKCHQMGLIGAFILQQFNNGLKKMETNITLDDLSHEFQNLIYPLIFFLAAANQSIPSFSETVKTIFQNNSISNLRHSFICNYGMTVFTSTVNAALSCFPNINIEVFNQDYFEILNNMDNLNYNMRRVKYTDDITTEFSIVFIDIHPNNAVESELYSHQINKLFDRLYPGYIDRLSYDQNPYPNKKIIVLDATLNILIDSELKKIITAATPLINAGLVELIIIQSLTKFIQMGSDIFSAGGVSLITDNSNYWRNFNEKIEEYYLKSQPDVLISSYFSLFYQYGKQELINYMNIVNKNCQFVYNRIKNHLDRLNYRNNNFSMSLTDSMDIRSCYISLNYYNLTRQMYEKKFITDKDISNLNKKTIELIVNLSHLAGIPLTQRQSIGFPTCNINECDFAIRLTIGIEHEDDLKKLSDIIIYVCYALTTGTNQLYSSDTVEIYFKKITDLFKVFHESGNATNDKRIELAKIVTTRGTNLTKVETGLAIPPIFLLRDRKETVFYLSKINKDMESELDGKPYPVVVSLHNKKNKIKRKSYVDLSNINKMLIALFVTNMEETNCEVIFKGADSSEQSIEITNFLLFGALNEKRFVYQTRSDRLIFTLYKNKLSVTDNSGEAILSGDNVDIHKEVLENFGVEYIPSEYPSKRYSPQQISDIEEGGWNAFLTENFNIAEDIESSGTYVSFDSLPNNTKGQIFSNLSKTNILFTNSSNPHQKKFVPVKLNIESKKYSPGNGFNITKIGDENESEYVLSIFAVKQPILNLFCQYVCILSIYENLDELSLRNSFEQATFFKVKQKSINEIEIIQRFSTIVGIFLRKNREIRKLVEKHNSMDPSKIETEILKKILHFIKNETEYFNKFLGTEQEDRLINAITIHGKNYKNNKEFFSQTVVYNDRASESTGIHESKADNSNPFPVIPQHPINTRRKNTGYRAKLALLKRSQKQMPKHQSDLEKSNTSFQFFNSFFFPRLNNKSRNNFKERLINENKVIMESICNLSIDRKNKCLHIYLHASVINIDDIKNLYRQIGYWLKYNLQKGILEDFEAKANGLFITLSSSQEAKDLKHILRESIQLFLKNNIDYVTFIHQPQSNEEIKSIHLAGSFNQWINPLNNRIQENNTKWEMRKDKGRIWSLVVKLPPGKYTFKYVINHRVWENSTNPVHEIEITPEGHKNSILIVHENKSDTQITMPHNEYFDHKNLTVEEKIINFLVGVSERYINAMRKSDTEIVWGGDIEAEYIGKVLDVSIVIHRDTIGNILHPMGNVHSNYTINLLLKNEANGLGHYTFLIPATNGTFKQLPIKGNGNCLFNACIAGKRYCITPANELHESSIEEISDLRKNVCDAMEIAFEKIKNTAPDKEFERNPIIARFKTLIECDEKNFNDSYMLLPAGRLRNEAVNLKHQLQPGSTKKKNTMSKVEHTVKYSNDVKNKMLNALVTNTSEDSDEKGAPTQLPSASSLHSYSELVNTDLSDFNNNFNSDPLEFTSQQHEYECLSDDMEFDENLYGSEDDLQTLINQNDETIESEPTQTKTNDISSQKTLQNPARTPSSIFYHTELSSSIPDELVPKRDVGTDKRSEPTNNSQNNQKPPFS